VDAHLCVSCGSPNIVGHATALAECLACGAIENTVDLVKNYYCPPELEELWAGAPIEDAPGEPIRRAA
jgi:hypothetical protein